MSIKDVQSRLASVVAITPAPFDGAGLDLTAFERIVGRMTEGGIGTLTVNGNTGEFYCLAPSEASTLVDATSTNTAGETLVVAGVGFDVETAISLARHAEQRGVEAIMIHHPAHPYVSGPGWAEYNRRIAAAVPDLAVIPYLKSSTVTAADMVSLAEAAPNVIAVKYALPDPVEFATMTRNPELARITWITGLAELFAPAYAALGATGFTSGLAAVAPRLSIRMFDALASGDMEAALGVWDRIRVFERLRVARGGADNVSVVKEALCQLGLGRADVRPPASRLSDDDRLLVEGILREWQLL